MAVNHRGTGGMQPHLLVLYRGGAEAGNEPDDEMVVSGCGTIILGVEVESVLI